jgi:two-component system, NarL family, nitrate/nitrite response regulator NarL
MKRIRLLLVDDHVLFRESVARLIASEPDFEVVADCGTVDQALDLVQREAIDIVLLDFDLGQGHGNQFIAASRRTGSTAKVLMVTAGMSAGESATALRLGAAGIFLKQSSPSALMQAMRMVASGATWVDQRVVQQMATQLSEPAAHVSSQLTERQQHVLDGIFEGLANKEIAARLGVSESAIKATLQQLFRKTQVRTRGQLVRVALEGSLAGGRSRLT